MLCGPTVAFLYMFHLVVVSTDMVQLTETVEQKPIKMLTNNVKKEITIALEELLLAKMLTRTSDTHNKSHKKQLFHPVDLGLNDKKQFLRCLKFAIF